MRYIKTYKNEMIGVRFTYDEFLQWFKDTRLPYTKKQDTLFAINRYIEKEGKSITQHINIFGLLNRAIVEARYLSETKRTKANANEVDFAKEILPFLNEELYYYELLLIPNLFIH